MERKSERGRERERAREKERETEKEREWRERREREEKNGKKVVEVEPEPAHEVKLDEDTQEPVVTTMAMRTTMTTTRMTRRGRWRR